ncbi:type 2C protein phosphatase [Martiniozyma asiatica (nom. inval.)]|nr:type 2C protein phosphatase [Martiniozyma asiatica]
MGQILSHPKTEKSSEEGGDAFVAYALSCMQGWRVSMEDSHSTVLNLLEDNKAANQIAFFGVYDGHGGEKVALFTGENLPTVLKKTEAFQQENYGQALKDAFLAMDVEITEDEALQRDPSGCAATSVIITKDAIYCGNAGDSRTILSINGVCKPLSFDHKPTNEGEKTRIVNSGGFVDMGRVNGNLALSRGIGDFEFKNNPQLPPEEQAVTALPDVLEHPLDTNSDEFIVLACDGIWDCLTSQQVVDFVRRYIKEGKTLIEICNLMMNTCLAPTSGGSGIGCDNMSVCIVALLHEGETLEEWFKRIADKVSDETLEKLATADQLSQELYNIDIESKIAETSEDSPRVGNEEDEDASENVHNAFLKQLLASASTSQNGDVIYLDPSTSSILQHLGVMEDAGDEGEHEIKVAEEEQSDEEPKVEELK